MAKEKHADNDVENEVKEEKKAEKREKNVWKISTIAMIVVLASFIVFTFTVGKPSAGTGMVTINAQDAAKKAIDYINANVVSTGSVSLVSVEETNGMYKITTTYQGQQIPVFITKDGTNLFLSQPMDTTKPVETTEPETQEIEKKEKAEVNLYVMAFCPYGVQAEEAMKPVADLLKGKADIKVRFIANVGGDTVDSVQSLHGAPEAKEDLRQLCIMKYYPDKYWEYVADINKNGYPVYRDATAFDAAWKNATKKLGINATKIEACAFSKEGLDLLKADEALTNQYGVSGSPTLIINGVKYSGGRDAESFKKAICSGFVTEPTECSTVLSGDAGTASGNC
ncbi:MAG: thioredoxin domain-containing protein [Candidatus Aenigmatarchaeota archaeon]